MRNISQVKWESLIVLDQFQHHVECNGHAKGADLAVHFTLTLHHQILRVWMKNRREEKGKKHSQRPPSDNLFKLFEM